jgi:hypothetical protein
MTERQRLIELLDECRGIEGIGMELVEKHADLLLTNGVIVPPCKVGDTVYCVYKGNTIVNALVADWKKETFGDWLFRAYFSVNGSSITLLFGDNNIGKTVFLTRDDAEKALEGMQ